MTNNIKEIFFNPENEHVVQLFLQEGCNIVSDLTKIPTYDFSCCPDKRNIPKPVYYQNENVNFTSNHNSTKPILENGKPVIIPNKNRSLPNTPTDINKFYSLTTHLKLKEQEYNVIDLVDLAKSMIAVEGDFGEDPLSQKSSSLPALFTYIGQFLDHDISKVDVPDFENKIDVNNLVNKRTSLLDLDSLFDEPVKYDVNGYLILEKNINQVIDVPRNENGIQIIGDIRNGENQIVLQVHMLFMKFYNNVLRDIKKDNPEIEKNESIEIAKNITRYTWQWLLVHSFMKLACGHYYASLFNIEGEPNFDIIKPDKLGALNAEWTFAFFRWHSLPQEQYYSNGNEPIEERPLFSSDGINFGGFKPLEKELVLDFGFFWNMEGYNGFQQTHRFGNTISYPLGFLPNPVISDETINLPERTLRRQNQLMMANGQDFAFAFGIPEDKIIRKLKLQDPNFIPNNDICCRRIAELEKYFGNNTPLFYYILYEAREIGNGEHLGPLGSKLFGLTLLAQLYSDPNAYLYKKWIPIKGKWGCTNTYEYTFENFIRYANDIPYPEIPIFSPNIFTNFFDPDNNKATNFTVSKNFIQWNGKIISTFGIKDRGKKLIIVNNLKNFLSNITIYVYNSNKTKILETITIDNDDKLVKLVWNGYGYEVADLCD